MDPINDREKRERSIAKRLLTRLLFLTNDSRFTPREIDPLRDPRLACARTCTHVLNGFLACEISDEREPAAREKFQLSRAERSATFNPRPLIPREYASNLCTCEQHDLALPLLFRVQDRLQSQDTRQFTSRDGTRNKSPEFAGRASFIAQICPIVESCAAETVSVILHLWNQAESRNKREKSRENVSRDRRSSGRTFCTFAIFKFPCANKTEKRTT